MKNKDDRIIEAREAIMDEIRSIMAEENMTQEELAERTGFIRSNISRMLAGKFAPTLDNLLIMLDALGYDIAFVKKEKLVEGYRERGE